MKIRSLSECCDHWLELLLERKKNSEANFNKLKSTENKLSVKLANFITRTYYAKNLK